jgi:nitrate reductase NapAB chaperone NapD
LAIKSYVACPRAGKLAELISELASIPGCEATRAGAREVAILVTETATEEDEEKLGARLAKVRSLQSLTMVYGCSAPHLLRP